MASLVIRADKGAYSITFSPKQKSLFDALPKVVRDNTPRGIVEAAFSIKVLWHDKTPEPQVGDIARGLRDKWGDGDKVQSKEIDAVVRVTLPRNLLTLSFESKEGGVSVPITLADLDAVGKKILLRAARA